MTTQTGSISFESTGGLKSYAKQNYATLSQIKGQFATCGTGASTATKIATIVPENSNWTLYEGATVTVKFTNKNETTTPTLNINNTGAKSIKDYVGNALDSAAYNWPEGAAMSFTYDGTSWRLQDSNLMERIHTAETSIEQNATNITLKANASDVYDKTSVDGFISQEVSDRNAAITASANSITQSVSSTYATKTDLETQISSAKSEIKQTTDNISLEVSKINSVKYINSSVASWTLANIKIYAAEGYNTTFDVTSTDNIKVGDIVYIKGTDSTRNCPVYIKTTIRAINSTTQLATTSHGYEDVLPVDTIKSTINQSADSVKIAANHIEIDGTTIFKNGNTTTTVNNYLAPQSEAVSCTQQIYYRTNTALTGSITGPTTWITKNDNGFNTTAPTTAVTGWSTKPTPLATGTTENTTKYLYLYTCIQTQTVEQSANNGTTCTASTVLLDDTETIIDGSKIITGTVSANSINANSGTFNTANIPDLNAEKITSGDIAADRIKTNVINAVNFSTDKIDADRISVSEISISDLAGEIGGRNLLKNTTILNPATVTWPANTSLSQIQDWYSYAATGVSTLLKTNDGIKITHGNSSTNKDGFIAPLIADNAIIGEKEYVLSFEYKSNIANFDNLYLITSTKTNNVQIPASDVPASETEWAKYSRTIEFESTVGKTIRGLLICYFNGSGNWIEIKDGSVKLEKGSKATDWTPALEDVNVAINDASKIASNYIHADSTGVNIYDSNLTNGNKYYLRQTAGGTYIYRNSYLKAKYEDTITLYGGSNESGANPKVELTSSNFKMTDGGGIQRLLLDSTDGAIIGRPDKGRIQITDVGMFVYDTNSRRRTQIDSDGLHLYDTDGSTESAIFSPTSARIGKENNVAFYVNSDSLQAYYMNGSTRTKYFEVTPNGMSFGTNTVASQSYVTSQGYQTATQVTGLIDTNQNVIDAKKHTQVLISAANVDYSATGSATAATFTARLYIDGTVQTSTDLKWLWYKDGTVQGSVQTAANGTLTVTGSMGLNHRYSCRCEF